MPKDQLGHIDLMLLVNLHRNPFAVIKNSNGAVLLNRDLDFGHAVVSLVVVSGVD